MQHDCTLFALWKTSLFWKKRTGIHLFSCTINYNDRMWCRKRTIANSNKVVSTNFPACSRHLGFWKQRKTEYSCGFVLHADAATPFIVGPAMLGVVASVLAVVCKRMHQLPTTCNKVCKRTQHVTSNNIGSCWPTMLRRYARGFKLDNLARLVTLRSPDARFACFRVYVRTQAKSRDSGNPLIKRARLGAYLTRLELHWEVRQKWLRSVNQQN